MNGLGRLLSGSEPGSPLSLREEFRFQRFGLQHDEPRDFMRSQVGRDPRLSFHFQLFIYISSGNRSRNRLAFWSIAG